MAFWNKWPYSNFHEINLDWIIREMKKISGAMGDFARQWEKALKQETGERQEADRQLQENIDAEQDRAEAAEEALDQKIEAETARATGKENDLQEQITAEVNRATGAENTLDQKITAETSRATAREDELEGMIQTETERATAKETELGQQITTETQRATAAEEALGDRIDGIEGELDGITGEESPFIRKDGTTTTTGKIPLAMGGTSEVDPAAATDLVNLRSMQAADQALESSMTEYVDNQLEAVTGDIHSIPSGGTAGQVLGKVDGTDYNVHWVDQSGGGSDPDAIKKDGSTRTTAQIPFVFGTNSPKYRFMEYPGIITSPGYSGVSDRTIIGVSKVESGGGVPAHTSVSIGTREAVNETGYTEMDINAGDLIIRINGELGAEGQVLTANANGYCEWQDAPGGSDPDAIKKDGSTVTTGMIPFAKGFSIRNEQGALNTQFVPNGTSGLTINQATTAARTGLEFKENQYISLYSTDNDSQESGVKTDWGKLTVTVHGRTGNAGQVLTADGSGGCDWVDAPGGGSGITFQELNDPSGDVRALYLDFGNSGMLYFVAGKHLTQTSYSGTFPKGVGFIYPVVDMSLPLPSTTATRNAVFTLDNQGNWSLTLINSAQITYGTVFGAVYVI